MNYIRLTCENLPKEHICCALSNNTDCQVASKKAWLTERMDEGLVFLRGDARGKCFIEYLPAEKAWAPVIAPGYLYIDCLWVSGQLAGHGYAGELLDACVRDAKEQGKIGLCVLSSAKKMPFLADPGFLRHKGFLVADRAEPHFELHYLPFDPDAEKPRFTQRARKPHADEPGFTLYYTHQCPYTAKYAPIAEAAARAKGVPFRLIHVQSAEDAQAAPGCFTAYALFLDGNFLTNEILSEKKLEKLFDDFIGRKVIS